MSSSLWKPKALDFASDLESTPPAVSPSDAQAACNFIIWVPDGLPNGCHFASATLRREAPPGPSTSSARTPWSQNNPSAYRFEIIGPGRRLRFKQFLYDWAFPALDHPCLWESETRAVPVTGPYVLFEAGPRSARSTTSGSRTDCRASKSPACAAAENASTTCRWRSLSGSGSVAPWFGGGALTVCELDVRVGGCWRMVFDAGDYILREGLRDR